MEGGGEQADCDRTGASGRVADSEILNSLNKQAGATGLDVEFLDTGSRKGNSGLREMKSQLQSLVRMENRKYSMKRIVTMSVNLKRRAVRVLALCAIAPLALPAQTFTTLVRFNVTDGWLPNGPLLQSVQGDLYGTTYSGGATNYGTLFKMTPSGALTPLYNFCPQGSIPSCPKGAYPTALIQDTQGNFYGTSSNGGTSYNGGSIFEITPGGSITTIYTFPCPQSTTCPQGAGPSALVVGPGGNFYGTTYEGGSGIDGGTVFKITPSGALTTLHDFCPPETSCADGEQPTGLVLAPNGDFYGTTVSGGSGGAYGPGTVYRITPTGTLKTVYSFTCTESSVCPHGARPTAPLLLAADGNFYGTTSSGGTYGEGTVFKITPDGALTSLYSFCAQSGCPDGSAPSGALVQGTDQNLYGTTPYGGAYAMNSTGGTIFQITPGGTLTTLHSFCSDAPNCTDGENPAAGLTQDTNGDFYGTTPSGGGSYSAGTVFSLSVGLGPFVKLQPGSGKAGASAEILGSNLSGSTSVTFNGAAAVFTVVSNSLIAAIVPAGATSGTVEVVTPGGTLSSKVPFLVRP